MRLKEQHKASGSVESQENARHDAGLSCSVIIPTFNSERYLDIALTSLVTQTRRPTEVIIVDAGSTDRTADIAASFSDRLTIRFIEVPRISIGPARNIGIKQASCDLVCFLDSDDIFLSRRLEAMERILREEPEVDVAHGFNFQWNSAEDQLFLGYDYERPIDHEVEIFAHSLISLSVLSIRRRFLLETGVRFAEDCCSRYGEDWDFCLKLIAAGPRIRYMAEPISIITVRSDSHTQPTLQRKMKLCTLKSMLACVQPILIRRVDDPAAQACILHSIDLARLKLVVTLLIDRRRGAARRVAKGFRFRTHAMQASILIFAGGLSPGLTSTLLSQLGRRYVTQHTSNKSKFDPSAEPAFLKLRVHMKSLKHSTDSVCHPPTAKAIVRDFWTENPCNVQFGTKNSEQRQYFDENETIRYDGEPEIFEFAQFTRFHGKKILEVGVGMGCDFTQWVRAGAEAHGVDLTDTSINLTRLRLASYGLVSKSLQQADAEALPFDDNSFDLVYSWGVIHHSPDTRRALTELYRVCKPGGIVKFMIYNKYSAVAVMYWMLYAIRELNPFISIAQVFARHIESPGTKVYSISEVWQLLENLPRQDTRIRCYRPYFQCLTRYPKALRPFIRIAGKIIVFCLGGEARGGYFLTVQFRKAD